MKKKKLGVSATSTEQATENLYKRGVLNSPNETYSDSLDRLLNRIASIEATYKDSDSETFLADLQAAFQEHLLVPGTPLLSSTSAKSPSPVACTVVRGKTERTVEELERALRQGIGIGVDLSDYDDPVACLYYLNSVLLEIDRGLVREKRRPVAGMASLSSRHPKVREFINAKREAITNDWRFNISLRLEGSRAEWEALVPEMADSIRYCAEPGVLYWDRFMNDNPTPAFPPLSTAPCAEVALAPGESCLFAYINLTKLCKDGRLDIDRLRKVSRVAMRFLDDSVDFPDTSDMSAVSKRTRRVGIGAMGFADLCLSLGVRYGTEESFDLAQTIAATILFSAISVSAQQAKERGFFEGYEESRYTDDEWLNRYLHHSLKPLGDEAADKLFAEIREMGVRNSHFVAFPPTGNSAYTLGVSHSIEPRREKAEYETYLKVNPELRREEFEHSNVTDVDISPIQHIRIQAAFQSVTVDSVSKTINLDENANNEDIETLIYQANELECKGLTLYRDNCLNEREIDKIRLRGLEQ